MQLLILNSWPQACACLNGRAQVTRQELWVRSGRELLLSLHAEVRRSLRSNLQIKVSTGCACLSCILHVQVHRLRLALHAVADAGGNGKGADLCSACTVHTSLHLCGPPQQLLLPADQHAGCRSKASLKLCESSPHASDVCRQVATFTLHPTDLAGWQPTACEAWLSCVRPLQARDLWRWHSLQAVAAAVAIQLEASLCSPCRMRACFH